MEIINQIFSDNYEMIDHIASLISKRYNVSKDELLGYGFESLYNYVSRKGYEKTNDSELYPYIHRDMTRCIPEILGFGQNQTLFFEYTKEATRLIEENGEEATKDIDFVTKVVDAIAKNSREKVTNKTKKEWINLILLSNSESLNEICESSDLVYLEKLSETVEGEYLSEDLKSSLLDNMHLLSERDKKLLIDMYGLDDKGLKTLGKLSEKYGISIGKIFQLEYSSLKKMRDKKIKQKLKAYTDYDYRINGSNSNSEVGRIIT